MTMRERSWIPPDGLERARPREVKLTHSGHALIAGSVAMWLGALGGFAGLTKVAERQAVAQRAFAEQSVEGTAEVTRLWRARGEGNPAWVAYRWSVDGRAYAGQARMRSRQWRALTLGSRIPIRYLAHDPSVSRLPGAGREPMPALVPYIVGGGLALGAAVLLLPLRDQRRLLSEGRAAPARVTRHKKGQHGTEFEFEFTALSGTRFKGKGSPRAKPPAVGTPLCVLYDPDHPKRNAMYPFSLVTPREKRSLYDRAAAASSARSMSAGLT
jgi:hypothetical protein